MRLPARIYQQFDADPTLSVPAEGYGGWQTVDIDLAPAHTALVVMHAWDCNLPGEYPGWDRVVEYRPRARQILAEVFPGLLTAVRRSPLPLFHVVGGRPDYYHSHPGFQRTLELAGSSPAFPQVTRDAAYDRLATLRDERVFPGSNNSNDVSTGFSRLNFATEARPLDNEDIAENGPQLAALCRARGINHLVYVGFAINWCLLMSPGGMVDMKRYGCLCSTIAEATTAVENRESARSENEKQQGLWRVALDFGFVFGLADFLRALPVKAPTSPLSS